MYAFNKFKRPVNRVDSILSEFKKLWRFYPEHSLLGLLIETTVAANMVESDLPAISFLEIEEIEYPADHFLSGTRSLEMGFKFLNEEHKNKPIPLVLVPISTLDKVGEIWRRNPQTRLSQLISAPYLAARQKDEYQAASF